MDTETPALVTEAVAELIALGAAMAANNADAFLDDVSVIEANDFSMLAWVRADATQPTGGDLFRQLQEKGEQGITWDVDTNNLLTITMQSAGTQDPNGNVGLKSQLSLADGKWHQVGLSVDRLGNYSVYDNGALADSQPFTLGALNASGDFSIGGDKYGGFFKGEIGEVRFYKRALTTADIADHYAGRFQQQCKIDLSVKYATSDAQGLSAGYNADLRIRKLLPDTLLSMPFDANVSSDAKGMIVDYSRFLGAGTKNGATWTQNGKIGGAYSFDSHRNNSIVLPSALITGKGDFTVMAWIYLQGGVGTSRDVCVLCNYNNDNQEGLLFGLSRNRPLIVGGSLSVASERTLNTGSWQHIAAVRKAGTAMLYLNGRLDISGPFSREIRSSAPLAIGNSGAGSGMDLFSGRIDEVRVFSRALTDAEISSQFYDNGLVSSEQLPVSQK